MKLGNIMQERLTALQSRSGILGDVRGQGLVWGLELVKDKYAKDPAPALTKALIDTACRKGLVMIAPIGFHGNVVRIAPPLVIEEEMLIAALNILEQSLCEIEGEFVSEKGN